MVRKILAAASIGALLALGACSPSGEQSAAPAESKTAEAPAEAPAAPEAAPDAATTPATAPEAAAALVQLAITDASGATLSGDPTRGQRVFLQCQTCHTIQAGVNRVGPSLHGIIGRQAGTVAGFRYSEANRSSGITWTEQELYTYLENPRAKIPGTIMAFNGLRDSQQRADVIAYLKQNTQ
ncbi:MAG: cytochrome c family protein [Hyphomonadaceae bacterium]|nr:cytochrome c family protein [Hyphomonadaceae bacterium]